MEAGELLGSPCLHGRDVIEESQLHPGVILDTTDAPTSQMPGSHQMKLKLQ